VGKIVGRGYGSISGVIFFLTRLVSGGALWLMGLRNGIEIVENGSILDWDEASER